MIVDGTGMIGQAFRRGVQSAVHAYVFARGVADSACLDEGEYGRERDMLASALTECRRSGRKLVYMSGAPIYGGFAGPVTEMAALRPKTRYGRHQAECEEMIAASGVSSLVLRLANIVGPGGNAGQLVPSLMSQILSGRVVVHGRAGRDLLDVQDVVRLTDSLLRLDTDHLVVNVASRICSPIPDIVHWLMELLHTTAQVDVLDIGEAQRFDTGLLQSLVGEEAIFPPWYPQAVLARLVSLR